jgi:hypothetical protein
MRRIVFASLAAASLFACQADDSVTPPGSPSALIQDGRHNGGNAHFFFLPPMVANPGANGVFNPALVPTVEITQLAQNGCAAADVRTFTGSEIGVSPGNQQYHVNWDTRADNLDPVCTYRIRVLVGSEELGIADVDVVSSGRELRSVITGEFIPLLDDRTLPIKFRIEAGALCAAGADCGEGTARPGENVTIVTQTFTAGVFVPAGAVDQDVTIIIESLDDRPCIEGLVGRTFEGITGGRGNGCYTFRTDPPLSEINPENERFNTPVIVGICVDLTGVSEEEEPYIQIFQFDEGLPTPLRALPNAPAPFLPCDPTFVPPIGARQTGLLGFAARSLRAVLSPLASLVSPQPLFASSRRMVMFDAGAGGSTDFFSTFTWGLVTTMDKNAGDGQSAFVGTAVATPPSVIFHDSTGATVDSVPVTWSIGSGGGSLTGGNTLSGMDGIATVGSWTLGAGTNTLIASAPPTSAVVNSPQIFTATGLVNDTIFKATFSADAANSPPGPPETGTWTVVNPAGTILVRSAVGNLTNQPVELDHNAAGVAGSLRLSGAVAGAPPATGRVVVFWRSLVSSADACFNGVVLRDAGALIVASVEYRPGGQLTYNSNSINAPAGTWVGNTSQLFRIEVDLDAKTTSLSIDGAPVSTLQGVAFSQPAAANLARISMELGCVVPPQQTYGWDDIMVVRQP